MVADSELSPVRFEVAYRLTHALLAGISADPGVRERRTQVARAFKIHTLGTSTAELNRIGSDVQPLVKWMAELWEALFDGWSKSPQDTVFSDGFAALFFTRVLWGGQTVLLRGHFDSAWRLQTSWARAETLSSEYAALSRGLARTFLQRLLADGLTHPSGPSSVSEEHGEAILQHYGFPADLLDFTYSYDVALYFAETEPVEADGSLRLARPGAIYAVPSAALSDAARLHVLPPTVLRPSLQRGVFIAGMSPEEQARLEQFKFQFHHQAQPVYNSIGNISWTSPVPLKRYLFPARDAIETTARPFLDQLKQERQRVTTRLEGMKQ